MSLASSGEELCPRTDKAPSGIYGVKKVVDDIFICGTDYDELFARICDVFAPVGKHVDITPNIIMSSKVLKDCKDLNSLPKNRIVLIYRSQWVGLSIDEDFGALLYY
ncbi:unnamed protein product [Lepeophtheirus salmonis]|uniref:(salmon louse) hypothetical protein n=1 Tax=Lepeophtheirus salmonis TaxID=72036 RepID=A0A7R8HAX1_LEPSM|nr:unnamed protein product [Lepeophtheirus salmonis]CAF2977291.1 unnamed protein product [Lepeophtheirus salmonis]